jgi:PAS domain S-box-containing protein
VWIYTPDGYAESFNSRWKGYTGQYESGAIGHGWLDVIHLDDIADLMYIWKESVEIGKTFQFKCRMQRKDGVYRWMLAYATPFIDKETGAINHWFGRLGSFVLESPYLRPNP